MKVINNSARLISINTKAKVFNVVPADNKPVSLSKEASELEFVKRLIDSGDLLVVGSNDVNAEPSKEDVMQQLDDLGVKYNPGAHLSTLKKLLDEASKDV